MKEVKLNGTMLDLRGNVLKDQTGEVKMNEFVADMLAVAKADGSAVRQLNLAKAIWDDGDLELEDADWNLLKGVLEKAETTALVAAQLLEAIGVSE